MKRGLIAVISILVLFSIAGCTEAEMIDFATNSIENMNLTLSSDAYLEIDGVAHEIPANITKIKEGYGYYLTNASIDFENITSFKVIDQNKTVFEYTKDQKKTCFSYEDLKSMLKSNQG